MDKSAQSTFLARWLRATLKSIWSKTAVIIFVLGFALAEIFWWKLYGLKKAWEQAIENITPVIAGVIITVIVMAIVQFFKVRALIKREDNELSKIVAQKTDEAKRVSDWLNWHLVKANIGISEAYLFGSITHNYYESNDVDVVLMFRKMKKKEYISKQHKLTPIANEFNRTFGKQLHFQRFLASESDKFRNFVSMQSEPISILRS